MSRTHNRQHRVGTQLRRHFRDANRTVSEVSKLEEDNVNRDFMRHEQAQATHQHVSRQAQEAATHAATGTERASTAWGHPRTIANVLVFMTASLLLTGVFAAVAVWSMQTITQGYGHTYQTVLAIIRSNPVLVVDAGVLFSNLIAGIAVVLVVSGRNVVDAFARHQRDGH
jgi:hypothetical protein